jgi:hypothetical protein
MRKVIIIATLIIFTFLIGYVVYEKIITNDIESEKDESEEKPILSEAKKLTIPSEIENSCFGFLTGSPDETRMVSEIGMGWSRPHIGPFIWGDIEVSKNNFDFSETDLWVKKAQDNNIATLGTIWPYSDWDQEGCYNTECFVSSQDQFYSLLPKSRCSPCNLNNYEEFLVKLVERYDGDGVNDMPGLRIPIKYWEILNEPEMNEPTLTFYKGTPEEYLTILKSSKTAIKSTCSDCKIVQGGAAGTMDFMLDYWEKMFNMGAGDYFDIANIHYIGFGDLDTLNVKEFKKLMSDNNITKPIWVTEAEYHKESDIINSVSGALNEGAEKIFFTRFVVGQSGPPTPGKYSPVYKEIECN